MTQPENTISLTINGKRHKLATSGLARLSDVLRQELALFGTKSGCDAGDCGACTVLIDGDIACACLVPIGQLNGANVATIEGLTSGQSSTPSGDDATLDTLQESFLQFGAAQCGICTPGMLVSAHHLLQQNPTPSRSEVADALGGVLCRCTGYQKIIDAVMHTSTLQKKNIRPAVGETVGAAIRHLDGHGKVLGTLAFGADKPPENALHVMLITSPHHHASFTIGDREKFIHNNPGIHAVFTAKDIPGKNAFGVIPQFVDQPVFAENKARFRGEVIAAIIGEADAIAQLTPEQFPVTWQELTACLEPAEAQSPKAPCLHEDRQQNNLIEGFVARGDAEHALAAAKHVVELSTSTPFIEHAYIEPEAGYAWRRGDRVIVRGCTQAPHMDREAIAEILGLDLTKVRVHPTACGGGFGSKLDISFQPYVALAAWKLNRPVVINYSRHHSMAATTKRHPSQIHIKVGCDESGKISGMQFDGTFNTGAYASWGPTVANRVPVHASGPYFTPHYHARARAVHTHSAPAGAFRGFGVPQAAIAQELAYDQLADAAGVDRLEFRLRNALENGQTTVTGQTFAQGVGIKKCLKALRDPWQAALERVAQYNRQNAHTRVRKGVGIASCWYGCGNTSLPNPSTIRLGLTRDGQIILHQGAMDIGQGANTVITQITADALGVCIDDVSLIDSDTDLTPDCGKTSASRQTYVTGNAAKLAGEALRQQILRLANCATSASIKPTCNALEIIDGGNVTTINLQDLPENEFGYVLMAEETYDPPTSPLDENGQGIPYAVFGYGAQMVELSIDTKLGTIKLDKMTTAHDVGRAINPLLVEGQIEGGVAQGIGLALMENFQPGRTENLHDYLIPTIGDLPEFENIIIEDEDAEGPYGAKGLGEHVLIPTAPAILNAIRHATGAFIGDTPATPDKVLAAINEVARR